MAGIGAYFTRYVRLGTDFLKGGNRIEWWVAGMASFMSGFSVWTFTGGAGFAYRNGVIGVFLLLLAAPAFVIGYFVFATRWRRARVTTVVVAAPPLARAAARGARRPDGRRRGGARRRPHPAGVLRLVGAAAPVPVRRVPPLPALVLRAAGAGPGDATGMAGRLASENAE